MDSGGDRAEVREGFTDIAPVELGPALPEKLFQFAGGQKIAAGGLVKATGSLGRDRESSSNVGEGVARMAHGIDLFLARGH